MTCNNNVQLICMLEDNFNYGFSQTKSLRIIIIIIIGYSRMQLGNKSRGIDVFWYMASLGKYEKYDKEIVAKVQQTILQ